VVARR